MKVEPFGNNSFLIVDALHQYLPFFADYHEKLRSLDSLFYSFHGGLGFNFLGLWAYYLSSPLNLIIVLFPKEMLNMVLSHLYIIKIALCGLSAAYYFRSRDKKKAGYEHHCIWNLLCTEQLYCGIQLEYYVAGSHDNASSDPCRNRPADKKSGTEGFTVLPCFSPFSVIFTCLS
ncbi:hypothetical protein HMPREF1011_01836 [Anaerostipes caccae]|nr:hypothetical protein HMPREF1011_01836 [Anaerostipes caccae]